GADQVLAYIAHRQQQGIVTKEGERIGNVSNAQVNRELEVLKRCFSLALQHGKIFTKPHIEMLKEAAPRAGFLGREQVDAICAHLSPELAAVIQFVFMTGWRIPSEVLRLEWRQASFMKRWRRACVKAGCPGRIPHDLRRSAVRTFVRAGVTEHVAMQLSGHKTPSVFRRYNIISAADLSEAAAKLDAA